MLPLQDAEYLRVLVQSQRYNAALEKRTSELEQFYPEDPEKRKAKRLEFTTTFGEKVDEWDALLEIKADMRSLDFLPPKLQKRLWRLIRQDEKLRELREKRERTRAKDGEGGV